jgi:hypothetical protein
VGERDRLDDILNHRLLADCPVASDGPLVVRVVMVMLVRVMMLRRRSGLARGLNGFDVHDLGDGHCRWGGDGGVNGSGSGHVDIEPNRVAGSRGTRQPLGPRLRELALALDSFVVRWMG